MIGKFTYEFPRRRPVALFHGHVVELHEVVDQRTLFIGPHVLQRAAGSLAIDIHRAQPSLAGIGPDRRLRAVDQLIVFARAAVAKRDIDADAAIGDRRGETVVINAGAWRSEERRVGKEWDSTGRSL